MTGTRSCHSLAPGFYLKQRGTVRSVCAPRKVSECIIGPRMLALQAFKQPMRMCRPDKVAATDAKVATAEAQAISEIQTNPIQSNAIQCKPNQTNLMNPIQSIPIRSNPNPINPIQSNPIRSDPIQFNPIKPNQPNPTQSIQSKPIQSNQSNPSNPIQFHPAPNPGRNVYGLLRTRYGSLTSGTSQHIPERRQLEFMLLQHTAECVREDAINLRGPRKVPRGRAHRCSK